MAARRPRAAMPREIPPEMLAAMKQGAREAAHRAYAPYSRFAVGAAVLADDGRIHTGANVENASFGLSICAERSAIFRAVADGGRRIEAIVVYTPTADATPPCGACRQVLAEFGADALIVCCSDGAADRRYRLAELLPQAFGPQHL
ncbi:MAG TPA: cytidine deaminase [Casimicrobiaceae bacterium]|nr:cytidine deaminase [Casimicrobiaceae bacterium]